MSLEVGADDEAKSPVFLRIAHALAADMRSGRLAKGTPLPGSRKLASDLGVHRNTVIAAYRELMAEGFVETMRGKGTYVAQSLPEVKPRRFQAGATSPRDRSQIGFAFSPSRGSHPFVPVPAGTFALGNVNLYVDANPTQNWRALAELRFTNYPNGSLGQVAVPALNQSEQRTSTTVYDVNAPDPGWQSVNWGGIVMQQAWIQGTFTDWLGVKVGYWLTPFGIWNIDHGTPTLIGLTPPSFTGGRFYPKNQLGVQAVGHVMSGAWTFNYTAYVSNGKTQGQLDPTNDKAYGLRLTAQTMRSFPMTFGLAGYTDRYSQSVANANPSDISSITLHEIVAYRQWDIGTDVSLDIDAFRFRTELAIERVDYEPGKFESSYYISGVYTPNHLSWGWFTIGAYRLPWLGLEPYISCELYKYPTPLSEDIAVPGVGLNIHVNTEVQLKTQFTRTYFFDFDGEHDHSSGNMSMLASRLVIAY